MKAMRLRLTVPTRPARDAVLAFLTGLEPNFSGPLADALTELRDSSGNNVAIAFEDGGLLQSLDTWANTMLPVAYHAAGERHAAERRARGILAALGRRPEEFIGRPASALSLYERRLAGFVRAMLVEPGLLVLDRLFEELGRDERQGIAACIELFGRRYPLRRMLYLGFSDVRLPDFAPLVPEEVVS
ncbi:MAG: putative transport system ATP-binding protein [Betaproteobacteria bacterium]|jgi:ABC-type nitrate/sulfonate/bicarbonate transport system ATPase subunit|nr:putative transport system ATP-binding protein [Betaproteobacteria bacterium]